MSASAQTVVAELQSLVRCGRAGDRRADRQPLQIPGSDLSGVVGRPRSSVDNGHPDFRVAVAAADRARAVVIGNGMSRSMSPRILSKSRREFEGSESPPMA